MAFEIEHKYLVKDSSYRTMASSSIDIRQGYLSKEPARTVRIRIKGDRGFLTVKGITVGDTRHEYEYEIPLSDAEEMIKMCEGKILEKRRYIVDYEGMKWEVDEFHGSHEGLVVAEIELHDSQKSYKLPPFVGENVTGNPAYYNSSL